MFTNAKTVMINNKEVQSIVTWNGGVLYEKPVLDSLVLTGDKSVIQSGETATLTATLTLDGASSSNKTISFNIYHNNMLIDTLTGTTNASGIATVSYVGNATGDLNIQASYSSLQSESIELIDCIFKFEGSEVYTNKFKFSRNLTTNTVDNSLEVTNSTSEVRFASISENGVDSRVFSIDDSFILEYDTYISTAFFRSSVCGKSCIKENFTPDTWYHVKVEKNNASIKWYVDNTLKCSQTQTASGDVSFAVASNGQIKLKNIQLY